MGTTPPELQQQTPFVETSQSCWSWGRQLNELYNTRANNYLLMDVKTVSKPHATGTCSVQTLQLLVAEANGLYAHASVG